MSTDRSRLEQSPGPDTQPEPQRPAPEIDVKLLAEKVYRLLLADLRLAQARGERPTHGRRRR